MCNFSRLKKHTRIYRIFVLTWRIRVWLDKWNAGISHYLTDDPALTIYNKEYWRYSWSGHGCEYVWYRNSPLNFLLGKLSKLPFVYHKTFLSNLYRYQITVYLIYADSFIYFVPFWWSYLTLIVFLLSNKEDTKRDPGKDLKFYVVICSVMCLYPFSKWIMAYAIIFTFKYINCLIIHLQSPWNTCAFRKIKTDYIG